MNIETLREYCINKPYVTEGMPFDKDVLVFKAGSKIFLLINMSQPNRFNVKCDPELAAELRERYSEVKPGYHMNKVHWNTVYMDGRLTEKQLTDMIDHSYQLIFKTLPKNLQNKFFTGQ